MIHQKKAFFGNCVFLVDKHVYEPAEDTFLIAENLECSEAPEKIESWSEGDKVEMVVSKAKEMLEAKVGIEKTAYAAQRAYINSLEIDEDTKKVLLSQVNQAERKSSLHDNRRYLKYIKLTARKKLIPR